MSDDAVSRDADAGLPQAGDIKRRVIQLVVVIVVVVLLLSALPGVDEVRDRFARADGIWIAVTGVMAFGSVCSYVAALRSTLEHRIPWRAAWTLGVAEQSSNVLVPTGGVSGPALGAVLMRRAGVPGDVAATRSAALFMLTSAVSLAAIAVAGFATGLHILPGSPGRLLTLLPAAIAAAVLVAAAASSRLRAGRPGDGRVLGRLQSLRRVLIRGVRASLDLVRSGDPVLLAGIVGYLAFDIAALAAAFEAFGGGGPPLGPFVLAYTLGQAGSLIPTPGGIGGTDGGLIGMFVVFGTPVALATASVLAYRLFQLGLPMLLGIFAFRSIRRRRQMAPPPDVVAARYADLTG
jgi:uncharacterized membrane protein YbhN (UPF0104 family)